MDPMVEFAVEAFERILSLEKSMELAGRRLASRLHDLTGDQLAEYARRTEELRVG